MLGLNLREEFQGRRITGTTIDFSNRHGTGALDRSAEDFLGITYPSIDLLKTLEAIQPDRAEPVPIIGARGQGKSHLMAALAHMLNNPDAGRRWLKEWGDRLKQDDLSNIQIRDNAFVIVESLHLQRYKFLWDLLFEKHPNGTFIRGKWEGQGDRKTDIPSYDLMLELFQNQPIVLILDEFQTWYEGLTNTKQYPWRTWAFNFIQILSEISSKHPELLALIVSVREGNSDAAQQIFRVTNLRVEFKGPQAKRDRKRLLLYRIFENRTHLSGSDISSLIDFHLNEYIRLYHVAPSESEKMRDEYIESWPYSPLLLRLLDDQVLIATDTQETRDLIRILVDIYKTAGPKDTIITAANFSLTNEQSGVAALLDSVANQLHRDLRTKAIRNLEAVREVANTQGTPHLEDILSALWLRSLSLEKSAGAEQHELQVDLSREYPLDDNQFAAELSIIEENSFNIHRQGNRLVFLTEENPQAKLMAHAKNDRLFEEGQDLSHLADEIRYVLGGHEGTSSSYRVIVPKKAWNTDPWGESDERDWPQNWDNRIPVFVVPTGNITDGDLGVWLKNFVPKARNTIRFLLPKIGTESLFFDRPLLILARAVHLAQEWKRQDTAYTALFNKYQKELRDQIKTRFDRFAILELWNFQVPKQCRFTITSHGVEGGKILGQIQEILRRELFIPEEFSALVIEGSKANRSVAQVLEQLKEPLSGGQHSIPWLGETEAKEQVLRMCAQGQIAINIRGREMLETRAGETENDAWNRMKGRLGTGRQLEETTLHEPGTTVSSGGEAPTIERPTATTDKPIPLNGNGDSPANPDKIPEDLFGKSNGKRERLEAPSTTSLNLLGKLESWGVNPGSRIYDCKLSVGELTGAQLQELLKKLPDGVTYSLDMEKE